MNPANKERNLLQDMLAETLRVMWGAPIDNARFMRFHERGKEILKETIEPERFLLIGAYYQTQSGNVVRMEGVANAGTDYETMVDGDGVHRYSRRHSDMGRCTGSAHDYSNPENIKRPIKPVPGA